jgi:hypothetical protein
VREEVGRVGVWGCLCCHVVYHCWRTFMGIGNF